MPSLGRRDIKGNAIKGKLSATLAQSALSFNLAADPGASGWPTGGVGPFTLTFERGTVREERVSGSARSSLAVTLSERGIDGTSDVEHAANSDVEVTFSGFEADWANLHYSDQAHDHHTQYLNTTRHAAIVHTSGMLGTDSVGTTQIAPNSVTSSELADNSVDTAAIVDLNVTGAKIANTTITAGKIAADTITANEIAPNAITASELANDAVDTNAIVNLNVTAGKIANGAVANGAALLGTNQSLVYVQATNPGAVGAGKLWVITASGKHGMAMRNSGDTGWEILTSEYSHQYTPTLTGITLGTGGVNVARYRRSGMGTIIVDGMLILGTGGDVTTRIALSIPVNARDLSSIYTTHEFFYHGAARASDVSVPQVFGGVGVIGTLAGSFSNTIFDFIATAGNAIGWTTTVPFDWTTGDKFSWFVEYEPSTNEDTNFLP